MATISTSQHLVQGRLLSDDAFFKEGDVACNMYKRLGVIDYDNEELCHKEIRNLTCEIPGCSTELHSVMELELHYNSIHRYTCATCRKSFASAHLLDLHIEESHDSFFAVQAERKPMYRCLVETCLERFTSSQERHIHCVDSHAFPSNFRWVTPKVPKPKSNKTKVHKQATRSDQSNDLKNETAMDVDGCVESKKIEDGPKKLHGFVFGRGNVKKSFVSKGTEWHRRDNTKNVNNTLEDSMLCSDLMNNLPSEDMS